ncbi:MAG: hypothetical protein ACFFD4_12585 [Candidatus Odinarchaeota archaeon]
MNSRTIAVILSFCLLWSFIVAIPANAAGFKALDEEATISYNDFDFWAISTQSVTSYKEINITIELAVLEGSAVDLMLFNESDFYYYQYAFEYGNDFYVILEGSALNVSKSVRKSIILPVGTYVAVVENLDGVIDGAAPTGPVRIHITMTLFEENPGTPKFSLSVADLPYLLPLLVIPVVAIIFAVYALRKKRRRKKWKPVLKQKPR